ncbi:hypothetical protein [Polyangium sp. 15x6]|uniref:hypothetical protein n=1 Tax=Polyangium sp. 15x6 TaxID=3042687 RepID=UPI00249B74FE|nr:hypothetical protein [Polyangium sp. 15x6]MDI3291534.1 hypothetical protein [Polyangium sp. 15x6]
MSGSAQAMRWLGAVVCLGALSGCAHASSVGGRHDDCDPSAMPSLGHDPAPFRYTWGEQAGRRVFRFEREPSGTTEVLRSVFSHCCNEGIVLAVGDRGTALVRHPQGGWLHEETGTRENLYAIGRSCPDYAHCTTHIAVGARGTALIREQNGTWRAEQTGVSEDLFAVVHPERGSGRTLAVGAGGVIVARSPTGTWHRVQSHTTADLYGVGLCANHLYAVGAGGTILDCRWDGKDVCIPQLPVVTADLRMLAGVVSGGGVRLTPEVPVRGVPWAPLWAIRQRVADDIHAAAVDPFYRNPVPRIEVGEGGIVRMNIFGGEVHDSVRLSLPFGVTLRGVTMLMSDGFIVGDRGTIVHLAVDGVPKECIVTL